MYFVLKAVAISLYAASVEATPAQYLPARRVEQSLQRRAFAGGWPLGAATCPSEAPLLCNDSFGNPNCCPSATVCKGSIIAPICCPTTSDCATEAHNFPVCSGKDQIMYQLGTVGARTFFCCQQGQVGVIPLSGFTGICRDASSPPVASLLATTVAQFGTTTVGPNPTNTPTATTTRASGNSNGGNNGGSATSQTAGAAGSNPTTIINNNGGSSSSSSSSSSAASNNSGPSLSTGAIAGIAIGGAAVIGIILALGWFCRRGRSHKDSGATAAAPAYQQEKEEPVHPSQHIPPYVGNGHGAPPEWKSPASQYSEIGGATMVNHSGVTSPVTGRTELSP